MVKSDFLSKYIPLIQYHLLNTVFHNCSTMLGSFWILFFSIGLFIHFFTQITVFFFFKFIFLTEGKLLYRIVLVSTKYQHSQP